MSGHMYTGVKVCVRARARIVRELRGASVAQKPRCIGTCMRSGSVYACANVYIPICAEAPVLRREIHCELARVNRAVESVCPAN